MSITKQIFIYRKLLTYFGDAIMSCRRWLRALPPGAPLRWRTFATAVAVDGDLKPSNYGQPLFQSHPHLCENIPPSHVATR